MLTVKDSLTSTRLLDMGKAYLDKAHWSYGWPSNTDMPFGNWNADISHTGKENTVDVRDRLPHELIDLWDAVNDEMFGGQGTLVRCYANRHTYGTEGYIHTDTTREGDLTCVIYMDPKWDVNWGGETVVYNADRTEIIKSVIPQYGRAFAFSGNQPHCAKPLSRVCPTVRTTLMFKVLMDTSKLQADDEKLRDFLLEINAHQLPHKHGSLMDHLLRTYYILKGAGAEGGIALAGGLHSVYGTNAYKNNPLDVTDTRVADKFGPEVDLAVRLFHSIDRPNVLENPDGSLNEVELFILRCIECANLYDQEELDPRVYPNLHEFAMRFKKG